jgi:hypothetical protein
MPVVQIAPGVRLNARGNLFTREGMRAIQNAAVPVIGREGKAMRDDIRRAWPVDTGAGRKSWRYRTRRRVGEVDLDVYSDLPQVLLDTIEMGRRPGGRLPPTGALVGWMLRHGMDPRNEFALRRKIARDGTKGALAVLGALISARQRQGAFERELTLRITEAANRG